MAPNTQKHEPSISEHRYVRISYGALICVFAGVFGFSVWMTTINIKIDEQGAAIQSLRNVDNRLTHVETLLENLTKGK